MMRFTQARDRWEWGGSTEHGRNVEALSTRTTCRNGTVVTAFVPPPCSHLTDLFYGRSDDGRAEQNRDERETRASRICRFMCPHRLPCLERSLVWKERYGVWGGMGEKERRLFRAHLKTEGYEDDIPEGQELLAALAAFRSAMLNRKVTTKTA